MSLKKQGSSPELAKDADRRKRNFSYSKAFEVLFSVSLAEKIMDLILEDPEIKMSEMAEQMGVPTPVFL